MTRQRINNVLPVEVRDAGDGQIKITGYAAVFYDGTAGTQYDLSFGRGKAVERIMPTAFNRALAEGQDVRALLNHDTSTILGRTRAGTLRLSVDQRGLRYEADAPDTQAAKDIIVSIRRGDVTGSSFAFSATGEEWRKENGVDIYQVTDLDLYDVGPVTFPAYEATSAGLRMADELGVVADSHRRWEASQAQAQIDQAIARARLVELDTGA